MPALSTSARLIRRACIALAAAALAACADAPTDAGSGSAAGVATLSLSVNTAAAPSVASIVVEVTAADLTVTPTYTMPVVNGSASGTIKVAPGAARTFSVRAYDAAGNQTHDGAKTVDVKPGANPPLAIQLTPAAGQVPITITFGAPTVALSRTALALRPGDTATVVATVTGADGRAIPGAVVAWSSSNPAKLTVDAAGLVTARDTGDARVVAMYEGVGAQVAATVGTGVWASLGTGSTHSCGLTRAGKAYCWGLNNVGQLGSGDFVNYSAPVPVSITGVTFAKLAVGDNTTCGVTTTGRAFCWGDNSLGQLGAGYTTTVSAPREVGNNLTWASVVPGSFTTCGVTTDGKGWCWGQGRYGQIGDGTTNTRYLPIAVAGNRTWKSIVPGGGHTCGITTDGTAYCWGENRDGQVGDGSAAWTGDTTSHVDAPLAVVVAGGLKFAQISSGIFTSCGLDVDGLAWCWGDNSGYASGTGDNVATRKPTRVTGGHHFTSVQASRYFACATGTDAAVWCWGTSKPASFTTAGATGQFPAPIATGPFWTPASVSQVWLGHVCVLATTGQAFCAGSGGLIGNGNVDPSSTFVPVRDPL